MDNAATEEKRAHKKHSTPHRTECVSVGEIFSGIKLYYIGQITDCSRADCSVCVRAIHILFILLVLFIQKLK